MALKSRDRDKVLRSLARWLAGLEPLFGANHYFERYSTAKKAIEKLSPYRGLLVCPFCKNKKRFLRASAFITHLIKIHALELEELIDSENI
jgi:glutaredoxin